MILDRPASASALSMRNRNLQQLRCTGGRGSEHLGSSGGGVRGSPHTPTAHSHQVQSINHGDYDDYESHGEAPRT